MKTYTFHVAASGYGIVEPPLGRGTLAEGCEMVRKLGEAYEAWAAKDYPEETGLHTVWEGCDIGAHPDDGSGEILYFSDESNAWEAL